jgi:hypothetical protein
MDNFDLLSRGFDQKEIGALNKWKDIWDTNYHLENYDLIRTLKAQDWKIFENANTTLVSKPITKNQNIKNVFDPRTQNITQLTQSELDALYNTGGHYAVLRRPIIINGIEIEHMMVRNTPSEYLRAFMDTDRILNYRDGYFTVSYKPGSKFVDEHSLDATGKSVVRTVAVAGNTRDAQIFANSQQAATGLRHEVRHDSKALQKDGNGYWDVNSASGRIAQRVRGKPLETASGINQLGQGAYIEDPMESAIRAAKSLSGRTVSRPAIETAKKRFVQQYGDLLPTNQYGAKDFPNHRSEIVGHSIGQMKLAADARTTYGYIRFMEHGYTNAANDIFRGGLQAVANLLGEKGFARTEAAVNRVANVQLTNVFKGTVYHAYIGMSLPIRQWVVQAYPATRTIFYNPLGVVGTGERISQYLGQFNGLKGSKEAQDFFKFVEDSGMIAGVDRNSLVRGLGLSMADSSSQIKRAVGAVASFPQTAGFDVGEKMHMLVHLASVHEKYTREGLDLANKTVRDQAYNQARALAGDLNKAGEYAFTSSWLAPLLQFLQMPLKGIQFLTNRKLDTATKLRLSAWTLLMFGAPVGLIGSVVTMAGKDSSELLPNDPEKRDAYVYGMTTVMMNKLFNTLDDSGEKSRVDFSSLAPVDMDGWAKIYHAMADQGAFAALAASPTGQILSIDGVNGQKRNGRIPQALITMGRFFNVFEEIDPENPTTFKGVLNDVAKISSGWTAASNAMLMIETRKKSDRLGNVVDSSVTTPEIIGAFMGFGTLSTKELYEIAKNRTDDKKRHDEDVMKRYRGITQYVTESLRSDNADVDHIQKVSSMLMRTFDDPYDLALVAKQWKSDMAGREQSLMIQMFKACGMPDSKKLKDDIKMWPVDDATKAMCLERLQAAQELRADNKKGK